MPINFTKTIHNTVAIFNKPSGKPISKSSRHLRRNPRRNLRYLLPLINILASTIIPIKKPQSLLATIFHNFRKMLVFTLIKNLFTCRRTLPNFLIRGLNCLPSFLVTDRVSSQISTHSLDGENG